MFTRTDLIAACGILFLAVFALFLAPREQVILAPQSLSVAGRAAFVEEASFVEKGQAEVEQAYEGEIRDEPMVAAPHADFELMGFEGPAPHTVRFTCTSEGEITEHIWDFGDGSYLSTKPNPVHTYQLPGTYTVRMTVSGPGGTTTTERTECVTVSANTIHVNGGQGAVDEIESASLGSDKNDGLTWETAVATIQRGLDLAAQKRGKWTVLVADGTYSGAGNTNLRFGSADLRLASIGGSRNCTIDCKNSGRAMTFTKGQSGELLVEGFTIRSGNADFGGGIYCQGASPTIKACQIIDCSADLSGGAIACTDGASPRIESCDFTGCVATSGGAVAISQATPILKHCTISDNSAGKSGGGVYCGPLSAVTLYGCTVSGNVAVLGQGGGVYAAGAEVVFEHTDVARNVANGEVSDYAKEAPGGLLPEPSLRHEKNDLMMYVGGHQPEAEDESRAQELVFDHGAG